MPGLILKG